MKGSFSMKMESKKTARLMRKIHYMKRINHWKNLVQNAPILMEPSFEAVLFRLAQFSCLMYDESKKQTVKIYVR